MSGPRRIVEDAPGSLGATLLLVARRQRPPSDVRQRGAALVDAGLGGAPGGAGDMRKANEPPPPEVGLPVAAGSGMALKWLGIGTVVASVVVAGLIGGPTSWGARGQETSAGTPAVAKPALSGSESAPPADAVPSAITSSAVAPAARAEESKPPRAAAPAPAPAPTERAASVPSPAPAPAPASSSGLLEELRLLDAALASLRSGEARRALAVLDRYERTYPRGALTPEARTLRVEALLAAGERTAALTAYRDLVASNPRSPHRRRLAQLLHIEEQ